jgi:hypothetical protein
MDGDMPLGFFISTYGLALAVRSLVQISDDRQTRLRGRSPNVAEHYLQGPQWSAGPVDADLAE